MTQNARVRCIADIKPQEVTWLWGFRIPRGKLSEIVGDPGVSKSTLTTEIIACVTTGRALPGDECDGECEALNVLLLSAEDGAGDTIRPRLDRAGADVARVHIFDGVENLKGDVVPFDLRHSTHRHHLVDQIAKLGVGLLVIDPLNAYLGGVDSHRDADVRGVLAPLAEIAESTHCAILLIRHLNKSSGEKAIYRAGGSIAFTAAVRCSMLVGSVDEESDRRAIVVIKSNLAAFPSSTGFSLKDGQFKWTGTVDVTANDLLRPDTDADESRDRSEVAKWLLATLEDGPIASKDVFERAAVDLSVSNSTVKRAKKALGEAVEACRESHDGVGGGRWVWRLSPRGSTQDDPLAASEDDPLARTHAPQGFSASEGSQEAQGSQGSGSDPLADSNAPLSDEEEYYEHLDADPHEGAASVNGDGDDGDGVHEGDDDAGYSWDWDEDNPIEEVEL